MMRLCLKSILLILLWASAFSLFAQSSPAEQKSNHITALSGERLSNVALRANVPADQLAHANGLTVNARLRKGQRLILPASATPEVSTQQSGEVVGKRIIFADGGTLDVDDVWKQGDTTWYRMNGTSQSASRAVRSVENRYKPIPANASTKPPVTTPAKPKSVATWIYLVDGARLRVDEVRQVTDGAWYNRGNLAIFLSKDRISRIEREDPDAVVNDWQDHGWSSGSIQIDQLIRANATRVGVDPYLVFLVIEQESHFRPRIVSPKGAQGLMQLMPGTARRFGVRSPFDPSENIRGGTQYLKELLAMFGGRVDLALASYNAGEGRVLDYGNRVPPFKETRDYVKRISSKYRNGRKDNSPETTAKPRE